MLSLREQKAVLDQLVGAIERGDTTYDVLENGKAWQAELQARLDYEPTPDPDADDFPVPPPGIDSLEIGGLPAVGVTTGRPDVVNLAGLSAFDLTHPQIWALAKMLYFACLGWTREQSRTRDYQDLLAQVSEDMRDAIGAVATRTDRMHQAVAEALDVIDGGEPVRAAWAEAKKNHEADK